MIGGMGLIAVEVGGGNESELRLKAGAVVLKDAVEVERVSGALELEVGWRVRQSRLAGLAGHPAPWWRLTTIWPIAVQLLFRCAVKSRPPMRFHPPPNSWSV